MKMSLYVKELKRNARNVKNPKIKKELDILYKTINSNKKILAKEAGKVQYLEGYEIIEIQTIADLRKAEWVIELCDFDEVVGLYTELNAKLVKFKPVRRFRGKFMSIVHNRLYDEPFTGYKGKLYRGRKFRKFIEENELMRATS